MTTTEQREPTTSSKVYPLQWDDELDTIESPNWLIGSIIPEGGLGVLYGDPGVGKTFIALDWALSIGMGLKWYGHPVERGDVVYVCAEGWRGMRDRVGAWKADKDIPNIERSGVAFLGKAVRLLDPRTTSMFCSAIEDGGVSPRLVVLDTLARNAVGIDENSAKDMGQVVASADLIREKFNCSVLLLHHARKSKEHGFLMRGSSALDGASDVIALVKDDDENVVITCEKQKDGPKFKPMHFRLAPFANSVVIVPAGSRPKSAQQEELLGDFPGE